MRNHLEILMAVALSAFTAPACAAALDTDSNAAPGRFIVPVPGEQDIERCLPIRADSARQLQLAAEARLAQSRAAAPVLSYCARHERGDDAADIATIPIVKNRWLTYARLSCSAPLAQSSWSCGRVTTASFVRTRRLQWVRALGVDEPEAIAIADMIDGSRLLVPACLTASKVKRELGALKDLTIRSISRLDDAAGTTARVSEGDDSSAILVHFNAAKPSDARSLPTLDCYSIAADSR